MGTDVITERGSQTGWQDPFGVPPCGPHSGWRLSNEGSAVSLATRGQGLVLGPLSMASPLDLNVLSICVLWVFLGLPYLLSVTPLSLLVSMLRPWFSHGGMRTRVWTPAKRQLKLKHCPLCPCCNLYVIIWGRGSLLLHKGRRSRCGWLHRWPFPCFLHCSLLYVWVVMIGSQAPCHALESCIGLASKL